MFEIVVGGTIFESAPSDYDHAFVVEPEGLQGWFDSVDVRGASTARPAAHGDFDQPAYRGSRIITITGNALATDEYELEAAGRQLTGLLANGEVGTISVAAAGETMFARVRLSGAPKFSPHPSGREAAFQISFKAADPRKYGDENRVTGGTVYASHLGNFHSRPIVEVTGPRTAPYTVQGPGGRRIEVGLSIPSGVTDRIDFAAGGVIRAGVKQLGAITWWQPWTIPPNRRTLMSISSGSMTVITRDTSI